MVVKNKFKLIACLLIMIMAACVIAMPITAVALETAEEGVSDTTENPGENPNLDIEPVDNNAPNESIVNSVAAPAGGIINFGSSPEMSYGDQNPGGGSQGGGGDSGGVVNPGGTGSGSVPRVIVTGFSTDPGSVMAGSNFNLVIHLRNTSKTTKVSNMLFTLSAPEAGEDAEASAPVFLPSSGSNSIYLESIKAGGYADISIELNAKSDLLQKPYSVDLMMVYEDSNANQYESKSSLSIPVKQTVRFEIGEFELSPPDIEVGSETNVMCNIYNMGRVKLYNAKAAFTGENITPTEVYLGNIGPGATASVDTMLIGETPTTGSPTCLMTVTYEDETGVANTMTKEFDLFVMDVFYDEGMMSPEMIIEPANPAKIAIPVGIAVVVAGTITGIIVAKRKKRKRRVRDDEESLIDEVDRPLLDE